jgi:hypothetical protein
MPLRYLLLAILLCGTSLAQVDAAAVLASAIKAQCPDGALSFIADFEADLAVSIYEKEGAAPKTGKCHQWWQKDGTKRRYHRKLAVSGGKTTHLATDGLRMLLWEEGGKPQDLLADPALKEDLKTLRDEIRRTEELLDTFMLSKLDGAGVTWNLSPLPKTVLRGEPAVPVNVRVLTRTLKDSPDLVLEIGVDDQRLYGVERQIKGVRQNYLFDFHGLASTGSGADARRVLLPQRVEYREDGALKFQANAKRVSAFKINSGLDAKAFSPPE